MNCYKLDKLLLVEDKVNGEVKLKKNDRVFILSADEALKEKDQKGLIQIKEDFSFIDAQTKSRVIVESGDYVKRISEDENWDREVIISKDMAVNFPVGARYLASDESNIAYTVIGTSEQDDNNVVLKLKKLAESKITEEEIYQLSISNLDAPKALETLKNNGIEAWLIDSTDNNKTQIKVFGKQDLEKASAILKAFNIVFN